MHLIHCCFLGNLEELIWTAKSCTKASGSLLPMLAWKLLGELVFSSAAPGL